MELQIGGTTRYALDEPTVLRAAAPGWKQRHGGNDQTFALGMRRERRRFSSGCKAHPATAQPEATGAVMEVTKWLKPSV